MAATESPPLVAGSSVWDPGGAPERQKLVGKLTKCVFQQVFGAPVELFSGVEETSDDFTQHAGLQAPAARVHAFSWTSGFFNSFNSCPQNQDKTLQHAAADEEEGPSFPLGRRALPVPRVARPGGRTQEPAYALAATESFEEL